MSMTPFEAKKIELNNFFAYWRLGESHNPDEPWNNPRYPVLAPRQTPIDPSAGLSPSARKWDWERRMFMYRATPGNAAQDNDTIFQNQDANRYNYRLSSGVGSNASGGTSNASGTMVAGQQAPDRTPAEVRSIVEALAPTVRRFGVDIEMLRILGHGGNGVASLFRVQKRNGGTTTRRKFVLKQVLRLGSNLNKEKQCTLAFKRSKHIIQALRWREELLKDLNVSMSRHMDLMLDQSRTSVPLEFMPHGDLWGFMMSCARAKRDIPDDMLWMIFACLVRACITMYAPPRRILNPDGTENWLDELGDELEEQMPCRRPIPDKEYDVVHFDLDPQNVFIGNFDGSVHRGAPVVKVGDFGLAKRTSDRFFTSDPYKFWEWRRMGKRDCLLPEQFHKEWEYIHASPFQHQPRPRVAGQYGPHSNTYAIGTCMHFLITQAELPCPPMPIGPLNHPETMHFAGGGMIRNFNMNEVPSFWTYGYSIARIGRPFDNTLCHLLLRCMADAPDDRPNLEELLNFVEWKEASWNDATYDRVRAFANICFNEPSPVSVEPVICLFLASLSSQLTALEAPNEVQSSQSQNPRPGPGSNSNFVLSSGLARSP